MENLVRPAVALVVAVPVVGLLVWWRLGRMLPPLSRRLATAANPYSPTGGSQKEQGLALRNLVSCATDIPDFSTLLSIAMGRLLAVRQTYKVPVDYSPLCDALPWQHASAMLQPGDLALESGVCRFRDGSVLVASRVELPRCSGTMLKWWFTWCDTAAKVCVLAPSCWHRSCAECNARVQYRLWHPEDHVWCTWNQEYLEVFAAQRKPGHERGSSHIVSEHLGQAFGYAAEDLHIDFVDPADWGITEVACRDAGVRFVSCMAVHAYREPGLGHLRAGYVMHIARDSPSGHGIQLRSRFWLGKDVAVMGDPVFLPHTLAAALVRQPLVVRLSLPFHRAAAVWRHATEEFSVLAGVLPLLFSQVNTQLAQSEGAGNSAPSGAVWTPQDWLRLHAAEVASRCSP